MTEPDDRYADLRAGMIEGIRAARHAEREIFAALDPTERDAPGPDGGWSAKDNLAHLSAWRQRQTDKLAAIREGRPTPELPATEIDDTNAIFHAERADWRWDRVAADADATADSLVAEVAAAGADALDDPKMVGSILGDGTEHDLGHLPAIAARAGLESQVMALAELAVAIVDRGGWPTRPAAYARYNLACYNALAGRLDIARALLRESLPMDEDLRTFAPKDDDLIALRAEIPSLGGDR